MNVLIESHGCKLNMADSQEMATRFLDAGFGVAAQGEPPDVYVLNSCTVTHVADRKARQAISHARRNYPNAVIVAAGCYPTRSHEEVDQRTEADLIVPNQEKSALVRLVQERLRLPTLPNEYPREPQQSHRELGRTRASVKIQEGCDQVCAYCIVPKVRGRERSIPVDQVVDLVKSLESAGCLEVVLTGTQLGTYGFDLQGTSLPALIREILSRTGIRRLRVSSLQAHEISDDLLSIWKREGAGRLCPHFHIPLQSGSDRILAAMRRRYDRQQFLDAVEKVKDTVPGCSVTTDIICGFPGETDADHADTLQAMERAGFADCHVFPFSGRPGTSATHLKNQVPAPVRVKRAVEVRSIAAIHATVHLDSFVGSTRQVLWEGTAKTTGRTDNYLRVFRQGRADLGSGVPSNSIEDVLLCAATKGALVGLPA